MILLDQAGAGAGRSRLFPPAPSLNSFVEHFWIQRYPLDPLQQPWRIVPDASPHLILVVSDAQSLRARIRCTLVGARSCYVDTSVAKRIFTCGARLRPGALPLLTRLPASDFTDRSVPVQDVFGPRGRLLTEQLGGSKSPISALHIISEFLSRHFLSDRCTRQNQVARLPLGLHARVEHIALQASLPARTLHSRMMQHVGLSPKRVLRVERLHCALAGSHDRSIPWVQIAANAGFADQAHMIREFHDLLGESPAIWRRRSCLPICSRQ